MWLQVELLRQGKLRWMCKNFFLQTKKLNFSRVHPHQVLYHTDLRIVFAHLFIIVNLSIKLKIYEIDMKCKGQASVLNKKKKFLDTFPKHSQVTRGLSRWRWSSALYENFQSWTWHCNWSLRKLNNNDWEVITIEGTIGNWQD